MSPAPLGKRDHGHSAAFFKLVAGVIVTVAVLAAGLAFWLGGPPPVTVDQLTAKAYDASLDFADAAIRTNYLLEKSEDRYPNYSVWEEARQETLAAWEKAEKSAVELQELSVRAAGQGEAVSLRLVLPSYAYDTKEIQAIFDAAPAGRRLEVLAKHLDTDAKTAFRILKGEMEMTAEKWNNIGDRYQALETGAILVKDGCKVIVAVGTVYASVGTMATAGAIEAAATIIPAADTFIEVGGDLAQITLGSGHELTQMFGRMRTKTEGVSTILAFANISNLGTAAEKVATGVLTSVDALNSAMQEGKILGFKTFTPGNILVDVIDPGLAKAWAAENGAKPSDLSPEDLVTKLREESPSRGGLFAGLSEAAKKPADAGVSPEKAAGGSAPANADSKADTASPKASPATAGNVQKSLAGTAWRTDEDWNNVEGQTVTTGVIFEFGADKLHITYDMVDTDDISFDVAYAYVDGQGYYGSADPRDVQKVNFRLVGDKLELETYGNNLTFVRIR